MINSSSDRHVVKWKKININTRNGEIITKAKSWCVKHCVSQVLCTVMAIWDESYSSAWHSSKRGRGNDRQFHYEEG